MSRHARRRRAPQILAAALGVGISTLAVSGVAYGYWTASGHGTGTASTGTARMSVATGDAPTGLYPGGPDATVRVTLTNTGGGAIDVASGAERWRIRAGAGPLFNNNYAGISLGPDGVARLGVLGGMVTLRDGDR